jgi:hypothetical protein
MLAACWRMKVRHEGPLRRGAGGTPCALSPSSCSLASRLNAGSASLHGRGPGFGSSLLFGLAFVGGLVCGGSTLVAFSAVVFARDRTDDEQQEYERE